MFENKQFSQNEFIKNHDERYPKRDIDLELEQLVSDKEMDVVDVISATTRLITRMEPMKLEVFKMIADDYIALKIEREEFDKALYYSYNALSDCLKDAGNEEKQKRKNKILDYIALCSQKLKSNPAE